MRSRSSLPLRLALTFNLVFSTLCAVAIFVAGPAVGAALGPFPDWFLTGLGIGLLGFAGLIGYTIMKLRIGMALIISVLDVLWVVTTLPLILIPGFLAPEGQVIVAVVAGFVGLACVLQLHGIHSMLRSPDGQANVYRHCVTLGSRMQPDDLWAAIRDVGAMDRYSAGLKSSRLEGTQTVEPGAVRVCTSTQDQSWAEEVVSIDDEARSLVLRFRTEAEDFPFPFAEMTGGWTVSPVKAEGSTVEVWWVVRPKQKRFGWLFLALMALPLDPSVPRIVAAMEAGGIEASKEASGPLPKLAYC